MHCKNCNELIEQANFCPHCGHPISEEAIKLDNIRTTNIRLETLLKLSESTNDEKALLSIKNLIEKLKENKKED